MRRKRDGDTRGIGLHADKQTGVEIELRAEITNEGRGRVVHKDDKESRIVALGWGLKVIE
jgi:hypothetical protein